MKIIAEFNSTNEVLDFINAFGAGAVTTQLTIDDEKVGAALGATKEDKKIEVLNKEVKVEEREETKKVEVEESNNVTEDRKSEVVKVTKEQVREVFSKLVKAGKQKEAKDLTAKYGASKVGEIKEEDYAAILKDAEELL